MKDITIYLYESENLGFVEYRPASTRPYSRSKLTITYCKTKAEYERLLSERRPSNHQGEGGI